MYTNGITSHQKRETSIHKDNTKTDLKLRNEDCVLVMEKANVAEIRRLLTMDHVNMIDLQLFSGPNFSKPLFPRLEITFVNEDGRVLISWLDIKYLIITWTLSAGRTRYDVHLRESPTGCIQTMKNIRDFIAGSLLKQLTGMQRTACEVCYLEAKVTRKCCKIAESDHSKYECNKDKYGNTVLNLIFLPNVPSYITLIAFVFIAIFCSPLFVQSSLTLQNNNTYYYLTESTMSISCIVRNIIWEYHGRDISILRRSVFVFLISFLYISHFRQNLEGGQMFLDCILFYWAILFPFTKLLGHVILKNDDHREYDCREHHSFVFRNSWHCTYNMMFVIYTAVIIITMIYCY